MRRRLALAAAAITTTIVLAFAIPLALLIRTVANDRALATADETARPARPGARHGTRPPALAEVVRQLERPATVERLGGAGRRHTIGASAPPIEMTTSSRSWPAGLRKPFSSSRTAAAAVLPCR